MIKSEPYEYFCYKLSTFQKCNSKPNYPTIIPSPTNPSNLSTPKPSAQSSKSSKKS